MKCIVPLLYILSIFFPAFANVKNIQLPHKRYVIICADKDKQLAEKILETAKPGIETIEQFFNSSDQGIITIYLTRSPLEFKRLTENYLPEWSQAVAIPSQKLIVLKADNAQALNKSPKILLHELVHIYLGEIVSGERVPVWLHEGLAEYLSGTVLTLGEKIIVANALASKQIIELNELHTLLEFGAARARLAYLEARLAVDYFVYRFGKTALNELLENLARTNFNSAFYKSTGMDFIDFEVEWYEEIYEKYRFLIILNIDNLIWILMVVLVLVAIYIKRRRNQKKYRDWTIEEQSENEQTE